jgi:manganese transport protein
VTASAIRRLPIPLSSPRRALALLGPGYVVAVGYVDPGNWATDIAAGAKHGFALLSAVLIASLVGVFLQALVVRLTMATRKDLAQLIAERFPRPAVLLVWLAAEIAMAATDLAELLGSAIALKLLFGLPIVAGVGLAALLTLAILAIPGRAGGPSEALIAGLFAVVAVAFAWELLVARPAIGPVLAGFLPRAEIVRDPDMLYLSLGILGATVMPHNLFLHSGLVRDRLVATPVGEQRALARWLTRDSTIALGIALLVNAAILALAAAALPVSGTATEAPGIDDAWRLIDASLGSGAALVFAIALLAAGQSATTTGTLAGQIVTAGFLGRRLPPWLRAVVTRGAALVPALAVPLVAGDGAVNDLLVLSQVVLGLALPFALVPLLLLLRDRGLMGGWALPPAVLRAASVLAALLTGLNGWLATVGAS